MLAHCKYLSSLYLFYAAVRGAAVQSKQCKPLPGDANWPSNLQWQQLNSSVSGRLLPVIPPGAVCHPGWPTYNNASCAVVAKEWITIAFQESNPWTSMYNDDTCLPNALAPCSATGYPAYAVAAETPADVQAALTFAAKTGVRLTIKGTGHDYPGRSAGAGSLSIWTHNMKSIEYDLNDKYAHSQGGAGSVKLGTGLNFGEIYSSMIDHNLTVIGGAGLTVGVGGWTQGGGHGPLTAIYGMGADQVLSMEVVTADGKYRVINATSDSDLFWAMRGGGPSTYAVMLSATVKVYPKSSAIIRFYSYNTTANSDSFWSLVTYMQSQVLTLSKEVAGTYFYHTPELGYNNLGSVSGGMIFLNKTLDQVNAVTDPIEETLRNGSYGSTVPVFVEGYHVESDSFMKAWFSSMTETAGVDGRLASRLLDLPALTGNLTAIKQTLQAAHIPGSIYIGHLVSGPGVFNAKPAGGSNAVLPAWRKSYIHFLAGAGWPYLNLTAKNTITHGLRHTFQPAMAKLAPDTGIYVNEADPTHPQWKQDYYGVNYPRLFKIKQKYDPLGVFWCKPCVGHKLWQIEDGPSYEKRYDWGVGQSPIRLCRSAHYNTTHLEEDD